MLRALTTVDKPGRPALAQVAWRLAVIGRDPTLPDRAVVALEREGLMVTLAAAGPRLSALRDVGRPPGLIVIDVDGSELEQVVDWVVAHIPHAISVVVVRTGQSCDAALLLSKGVSALIHEPELGSALGPVFRAAAAGHVTVPAALRNAIERPPLSHRERQTLGLAAAGLTNAEIGRRLFIGEATVKTHLSSAFRRLGVHSRREAAALLTSDRALRGSVLSTLRLAKEFPSRGGTA